jgi:ligand-binding sensor domain-containing protein
MGCYTRWVALVLLLIINSRAVAQKELLIEPVLRSNGQNIGQVNKVTKDHLGYIWIGCESGLYRYDSKNIVSIHQLFDAEELPNSPVNDLAEDKAGNLWVASHEGLFRINANRTEIFKPYPNLLKDPRRYEKPWVNRLYFDEKNNLWLGSHFGLEYLDLSNHQFINYPVFDHTHIPDNRRNLFFIEPDNSQHLWLGTIHGLIQFNLIQKTWSPVSLSSEASIPDFSENTTQTLFVVNDSLFLIGTWASGLKIYNPQSGAIQTYLYADNGMQIGTRNIILDIEPSLANTDEVYIASADHGLGVFNLRTHQYAFYSSSQQNAPSFENSGITTLYHAPDKLLWIGGESGLQTHLPFSSLITYYQLEPETPANFDDRIISVAQDTAENKVYLGTFSHGVWVWNQRTDEITQIPPLSPQKTGVVESLVFTHGWLYISGSKSNLAYNPITHEQFNFTGASRKVYTNSKILNDSLIGFFSFQTKLDVYNIHTKTLHTLSANNPIDDAKFSGISSLYMLTENDFWFGTYRNGAGIYHIKTGAIEWRFLNYKNIPVHDIMDIAPDHWGCYWFCTFRMGIFRYNPFTRQLSNYRSFNDVNINALYSIKKDAQGNLWMATNDGLLFLNPANLQAKMFTKTDGLKTNRLGLGIFQLSNNLLLVPHLSGFSIVDQKKNTTNSIRPQILINSFSIGEKKTNIKTDTSIVLRHAQNSFEIEFAATNYIKPQFNNYSYKLEGHHNKWIDLKNTNHIFLSKIPPGSYTLVLRATNNDGLPANQDVRISILIKKPFWGTWWFYALIVMVVLLFIYLLFQIRIRQIKKLQKMRNKIASDLHDDVGSALSSIQLYSGFISKKPSVDAQVSEVFSKIENTAKGSLESMSDIVWSINPKNDKLEQVTNKMKAFSDNMLSPLDIRLHYTLPTESINITMDARRHLYLFYKEAINNIAKYSKAKNTWIELTRKKGGWRLTIKDDGIGFVVTDHTGGNGMTTLQERAKALNGSCLIQSSPGHGTSLQLIFKTT